MTARTALLSWALALGVVAAAPGGPRPSEERPKAVAVELSGRWVYSPEGGDDAREKIHGGSERGGGPGGGGRGGGGGRMGPPGMGGGGDLQEAMRAIFEPAEELTISQTTTEITVDEKDGRTRRLHPDGRKYKTDNGAAEIRADWKEGKLVVETKRRRGASVLETWELVPDGSRIVVSIQFEGGFGPRVELRRVYDRAREGEAEAEPEVEQSAERSIEQSAEARAQGPPPKAPAPMPASTVASATGTAPPWRGIEAGDIDRSVSPCVDFYEFANGTWRAENPIPPTMVRWSRRWAAGEATKDQLRAILEDVSSSSGWPKGSVEQLVGDHYAACMDEKRVEELGLTPLQPLLAEIDGVTDIGGVQAMIGRLHELGVAVPFRLAAAPDNHDPARVIADLQASGLGLPDRDYYLKAEPRFQEAREKYLVYVAHMIELTGKSRAESRRMADAVVRMERQLAAASLDNVARRDPHALDHKTGLVDLTNLAPDFDWPSYFGAAGLPRAAVNVEQPEFLKAVDELFLGAPLGSWKAYLRWHLARSAAPYLPSAFVKERFAFEEQYLSGAKEMRPRWLRCVESTDELLGEALGRKYVEKHFPPAARARMQELVKNLRLAMGDTIRGLQWMGPRTKAKALEKLATFDPKVGHPDRWKDYSKVDVARNTLWANVEAARRWNVEDERRLIGKPVDRGRWGMTPSTSNAYYDPLLNEIVFPAGILQPPAFSSDAPDAANYGAIGVVIGHEISHGFDDQGAQYDARGRLANWWTADDLTEFRKRGQCVVDQYEGYEIEPGIHHSGRLVLGEAMGDLAGVRIAYRAFRKALEGKPPAPTVDGFTPEQQFFVAWGQFRGDAIRPETQRLMVQGDPHPVAKFRVIGPLSNLAGFREAFRCPADAPMVRPPASRCEVW